MSEFIDSAIEYAENGWAVFPLKAHGKDPLTQHGCKDATKDIDQIRSWWTKWPDANIGIATGQISGGLVVIDLDIDEEKGKNGVEALDEWERNNGNFPQTWRTVTGRGGSHLLYVVDRKVGNKVNALPGVDVRGDGGYIVAPPSIHPNGNSYEWEWYKGDCELAQMDETLEFFLDGGYAAQDLQQSKPFGVPERIGKGGRNDTLYRLACSLQAKGLDDMAILAAVEAENKAKCEPPLSDREIRNIVSSALSHEKGAKPKTEEKPEPKKERKKRVLKNAQALMEKQLDPPRVFVGDDGDDAIPLLVEGTCILSAKPKLGKSWFVLAMCIAISLGEDFLGYKTHKCSTLYLDLETSEQLQQKRIRKIMNGRAVPENFYLDNETDSLDNGFVDQIEEYIRQDPNIGVVVVDVFQIIRSSMKNAKENEYEHAYRDITPLNELAKKHHISIILVCHDRKMVDLDDPFANILGSTGLQGAVAQMMVMFKPRKELPIHLSVKGKTLDGIIDLDVELENGQWSTKTIAACEETAMQDEYYKSNIRTAVLALAQNGYSGRCAGIIQEAAKLGVSLRTDAKSVGGFIHKYIGFFVNDGVLVEIVRNGSGGSSYRISKTTVDTVDGWYTQSGSNPWE